MTTTGQFECRRGFTLLELIIVMVVLTIGTAVVAPRLTGFFQGRRLDDEARRLWALTRFAREEAIMHALPMRVWVDNEAGQYGIETVAGYGYARPARTYSLPEHVSVFAELAAGTNAPDISLICWPDGSLSADSAVTLVLQDSRNPLDAWRITRAAPLSVFTLERGVLP